VFGHSICETSYGWVCRSVLKLKSLSRHDIEDSARIDLDDLRKIARALERADEMVVLAFGSFANKLARYPDEKAYDF
jgi:hypothetical protein